MNRKNALDEIGFPWDLQEENFQQNLLFLKVFRENNPNKWPNNKSSENLEKKLGSWCNSNRYKYKKGRLSSNHIKALETLGFLWNPLELDFEINLKLLKEFRQLNPGLWPKTRGSKPLEKKLAQWCKEKRRSFRIGQLPPNRIKALNELGFPWEQGKTIKLNFQNYLNFLRKFRSDNPNEWPIKKYKNSDGVRLGAWCAAIRKTFNNGKLSLDKKNALDEIGFPWETNN